MTCQKLAKQEAAAWMVAAKGAEESYPGVFARAEEVLVRAGKVQLSYVDAHNVALGYLERCLSPAGRLAVHAAGYSEQAYQQNVDKYAFSAIVSQVAVSCNYRLSQQVVSFDPTISEVLEYGRGSKAALNSKDGEPLPTELLGRLPFETFVIVPNFGSVRSFLVNCIRGWTDAPGQLYLNVVARLEEADGSVRQIPAAAMLETGLSLAETIDFTLGLFRKAGLEDGEEVEDYHRQVSRAVLAQVLPYLLYLCAENREVDGDLAAEPKLVSTKKGKRLFARDAPNLMEAGVRIGAAIRSYRQSSASDIFAATGAGVVPHLRAAHWHTFWKGPRNEVAKRHRILHFLPPIPVNVERPGDLQPVVRPVQVAA